MWPVLSLLFTATFWGIVWYPLRLLEGAGLSGSWQMLVSYGAAIVLLRLVKHPTFQGVGKHLNRVVLLALSAGWVNVGFVLAMLDGTVARALILFYLSPLWTVILGRIILKEALATVTLVTLPLGLVGVLLMLWEPGVGNFWDISVADVMAITAGMAFAFNNVFTRELEDLGIRQKTLVSWLGVVTVSLLVIFLRGESIPDVALLTWAASALLGLSGFFLATLAVVYGVSHMPVQRSAVILLIEILVGAVSAWLIAGETMVLREWLGGALILFAGFIAATHGGESR